MTSRLSGSIPNDVNMELVDARSLSLERIDRLVDMFGKYPTLCAVHARLHAL